MNSHHRASLASHSVKTPFPCWNMGRNILPQVQPGRNEARTDWLWLCGVIFFHLAFSALFRTLHTLKLMCKEASSNSELQTPAAWTCFSIFRGFFPPQKYIFFHSYSQKKKKKSKWLSKARGWHSGMIEGTTAVTCYIYVLSQSWCSELVSNSHLHLQGSAQSLARILGGNIFAQADSVKCIWC